MSEEKTIRKAVKRNKSWAYWMYQLEGEKDKMCDHLPYSVWSQWSFSDEEIDSLLERYCADTDEVCEQFALNGEWPGMTPEVRYSVWRRLNTASDLVLKLYLTQGTRTRTVIRPPDLSITPIAEVRRFFLIVWWRQVRSMDRKTT